MSKTVGQLEAIPGAARQFGRVGFAATTHELGWTTNRTVRLRNLSPGRLQDVIGQNLDDLERLLAWMAERGLRMFRLGSSIIPFASHQAMPCDWSTLCGARLAEIGRRWAAQGFRFSMHPGQYTLLNSPDPHVVQNSLAELAYSCRVLDLMGLDRSHKVVLHAGGVYGDKLASTRRLVDVIHRLDASQRRRLLLENDERFYNFAEIVAISEETGIPAVFDLHHEQLNPSDRLHEWLTRAAAVWDSRPKVHLSSQKPGARAGAHDLRIHREDFERLRALLPYEADLMIEAKGKEVAALEVLGWIREANARSE